MAMSYKEIREQLIWNLRLDFDPVGIRFIMDEAEIESLPVTHQAGAKIDSPVKSRFLKNS